MPGSSSGSRDADAVEPGRWHVETIHVRPAYRRQGVAKALLRACSEAARKAGATHVSLEVLTANEHGEMVWRRLGFEPVALLLAQSLDALDLRLGDAPAGPSHGSTHVQTDDRVSVERAVAQFVPRLENADVRDATGGWIRIVDPVFDADRDAHATVRPRPLRPARRSRRDACARARRGRPLPALRARPHGRRVPLGARTSTRHTIVATSSRSRVNPTIVARLTGADREEVRRVARTAASPADLPPPEELYDDLAA